MSYSTPFISHYINVLTIIIINIIIITYRVAHPTSKVFCCSICNE